MLRGKDFAGLTAGSNKLPHPLFLLKDLLLKKMKGEDLFCFLS